MRLFILSTLMLLALACAVELHALAYSASSVLHLFRSQPVPQQMAVVILFSVPLLLLAVAFLEHQKLRRQRKAADALAEQLRGVTDAAREVSAAQAEIDRAGDHLSRTDPEHRLGDFEKRLGAADEMVLLQQHRNEAADLLPRIAHIRERQLSSREKLGDLIAKRNSIETLLAEVNSSQDDIEQSLSRLEVDKDGDKIAIRLQNFTEFNKRADSRCEELERSLQSLNGLDNELTAMKARATPLMHPETGIRALLQGLQQGRTSLSENLDALEQDEASPLSDRVQQLSDCKAGLEERVSGVLSQLQKLDSIQNDLTALFAKFNRAQRMARELDPRFRVVSQSG